MNIFVLKYILRSTDPNALIMLKKKETWMQEKRCVPGFPASQSSTPRTKHKEPLGLPRQWVACPWLQQELPEQRDCWAHLFLLSLNLEALPAGITDAVKDEKNIEVGGLKKEGMKSKKKCEVSTQKKSVGHLETGHASGGWWVPQPSS